MLKVIIDIIGLISTIFVTVFYLLPWSFVLFLSSTPFLPFVVLITCYHITLFPFYMIPFSLLSWGFSYTSKIFFMVALEFAI